MPRNNPVNITSIKGGLGGELWSPKEKLCFSLLQRQRAQPPPLHHNHPANTLKSLFQIHAFMLRHALDANPSLLTCLISSSSSSSAGPHPFLHLRYARRVFDHRAVQDTFLCNTMIRAYLHQRQFREPLALYRDLRREADGPPLPAGFYPDSYTFTFLLKSCASASPTIDREAQQIHDHVDKMGFRDDLFVATTLLDVYAKSGDMVSAEQLFGEMPHKNPVSWTSMVVGYARVGATDAAKELFRNMPEKDIAAYNAMIDSFAKSSDVGTAQKLFDAMPERNVMSWTCLISGLCKVGNIEVARALFDEMPEKNLFSWNAMIGGYSQNREPKRAFELFRELLSASCLFQPDEVTIVSVVPAIADLGALDLGGWIHGYVRRKRLDRATSVCTALVDMYAKCGDINKAKQVFDEMPERVTASWNAMINGFAVNGCAERALNLFMEMQTNGIHPNEVTMIGVLSACNHGGLVEEGKKWFREMELYEIERRVEHYGCMVDLLGRAGHLEEAERLIEAMPCQVNGIVLSSLLFACGCHGDVGRAEKVMRKATEVDPSNFGNYVIMRNLYAGKRRWGDMEGVKGVMLRNRGKKDVGCSVIEVGSLVSEFVAGDRVHPESEVIYGLLGQLWFHMKGRGEEECLVS